MSVASIADRKAKLIRKALDAVVFAGPEDSEPHELISQLNSTTSAIELKPLPTGYVSLGHHTEEDGVNWTREVENSDTRSHGSQEPTRRDITSDVSGLAVIAQETKMQTLEMFNNVDLSGVTPETDTSEVAFNRARVAKTKYYRILALAQDGAGDDAIWFARFLPRASVTEFNEQGWVKETEVQYPLTLTAYVDEALGYSIREMWAGPAMATLAAEMGFGTTP